jgi:hypothetical protein
MATTVRISRRSDRSVGSAAGPLAGVNPYFLILAVFIVVHALLLVHDLRAPTAFLSYDRTDARIEKIVMLLAAPDTLRTVIANSAPGDYIFQAVPYWLAGPIGVILFHLLLAALGTLYAYRLARSLLDGAPAAVAATLIYVVLPGSLWTPHVLASEAVANPMLVIALFGLIDHARKGTFSRAFFAGLLALGIALFVRPQYVFLPILFAVYGCLHNRASRGAELAAPLISFLPLAIWSLVLFAATGSPFEPMSDHGMAAVLHQRVTRAAVIGAFQSPAAPDVAAFLDLLRHHPRAFLQTYISDFVNFAVNPGFSGLSNYLGWFSGYASEYWTDLRDKAGYAGVARAIVNGHPAFAVIMVGGALLWGLALLLAARGAWAMFVRRSRAGGGSVIAIVILYVTLIVFVSGAVRWTHRTPLDPLLAPLIMIGLGALLPTHDRRGANARRPNYPPSRFRQPAAPRVRVPAVARPPSPA